jgi:glutathione S-transferase
VTPEDETWQDTSEILDALEARHPEPALYPSTPVQRVAAYLLELYADEFLVLPAMHYRWSTPEGQRDARGAFAALSGDLGSAGRFADRMAGTLPALGVTPETIPAIEAHLDELLGHLEALLGEQPFVLGHQPSLADCALMGPLYAHLYLDLVPGLAQPRAAHEHGSTRTTPTRARPRLLPGDALPRADRDPAPGRCRCYAVAARRRTRSKPADAPCGQRRASARRGHARTRLRGVRVALHERLHALDAHARSAYRALGAPERAAVDAALAGTGCDALLAYAARHRLGKRSFQLVFEAAPRS